MELPSVPSVLTNARTRVRYVVLAYRSLNPEELIWTVRQYLRTHRKKPKRGDTIQIVTMIGVRG